MAITILRLDRLECPADTLGARLTEGVMQPGFLGPAASVVRTVAGTRAMPFGRQEVRVVFFGRVPVSFYALN